MDPTFHLKLLAKLPREIVIYILGHYIALKRPLKHLVPFLTASRASFNLVYPFVWTDVCINAITFALIDDTRRVDYAKCIRRFRDAKDCSCCRCMPRTVIPRPGRKPLTCLQPEGLSSTDVTILQNLTFPRLHTLDFHKHGQREQFDALRQIGRAAGTLRSLRIKCWEEEEDERNNDVNGSLTSSADSHASIIDAISYFKELQHLAVESVDFSHMEVSDQYLPWSELISAELFSGPIVGPREICDDDFPNPDTCSKVMNAISQARKLQSLSVFIPEDVNGIAYPDDSWGKEPADEEHHKPFPALNELRIAIQTDATLRYLPRVANLTKLYILFDSFCVDKGIIDILPEMPQLTHLELLATHEGPPNSSWSSDFTVADVGSAIQPMQRLTTFRFDFPAWGLHRKHSEAAHDLLLSIATYNQRLRRLHLGFSVPFPLPSWRPPTPTRSRLRKLTTETCMSYENPTFASHGEAPGPLEEPNMTEDGKKLRHIFPKLRTFISESGAARLDFSK